MSLHHTDMKELKTFGGTARTDLSPFGQLNPVIFKPSMSVFGTDHPGCAPGEMKKLEEMINIEVHKLHYIH